jgi:hypothetical protein
MTPIRLLAAAAATTLIAGPVLAQAPALMPQDSANLPPPAAARATRGVARCCLSFEAH